METGDALAIVYEMASRLYRRHGEMVPSAATPSKTREALDTVEDFVVNNFSDEEPSFTVLLLRPDNIADSFGQDTFLTVVTAPDVEAAIGLARRIVIKTDGGEGNGEDYPVLFVAEGCHMDIKP